MTHRPLLVALASASLAMAACTETPSAKKTSGTGSTGGGSTSSGLIGGNLSASTGSTATASHGTTGGASSSTSLSSAAGSTASTGSTGGPTSSTGGSPSSTASTGSTGASTNTASTTGGGTTSTSSSASSSTGTTGPACDPSSCYDLCQYVGAGNDACCCNGYADANGFCNTNPDSCFAGSTNTTSSGGSTGGTTGVSCGIECQHAGFHCENGQCVLNGNHGPIQVTLEWQQVPRAREDLDLHVIEPGGCEISYVNRQCVGKLDLDANAGCANTDPDGGLGSDTENVIYDPSATPPSGTYTVVVDDYTECDSTTPIHYTVTIRAHGQTTTVSDTFNSGDADTNCTLFCTSRTDCTTFGACNNGRCADCNKRAYTFTY